MTRISLAEGQAAAVVGGWLQERYHSSDGDTVADFLSFRSVYEINPYEVGGDHSGERAAYLARRETVARLLGIDELRRRPVVSLSNGELRRVVLARALLRESGDVSLDGGCGGFDPSWRARLAELSGAMRPLGVRLRASGVVSSPPPERAAGRGKAAAGRPPREAPPLVEIAGLDVSFGARRLFGGLSWTIREGERWVLRGANGSGKTTLFALVAGDSPLAYACDIKVFGVRRGEPGVPLDEVRAGIGSVSSMQTAYGGAGAEEQLDAALRPGVRLLLLDEPCCDMTRGGSRRFARRVAEWLRAHPRAAAVWVEHDGGCIPRCFSLVKTLGEDEAREKAF